MYWSIHKYPDLAGRPRAERQAIVQAAVKEHRRSFGWRLLVVFSAVAGGAIAASLRLSPRADLYNWRTWIAPAAAALFIYGYLLIEINGPIHSAVKKYLESRPSKRR